MSVKARQPLPPSSKVQAIGDVLSPLMAQLAAVKRPTVEEIERVWRRLVGVKAARHSYPTSLRHGELLVAVDTSAWLWNLSFQRARLVEGFRATWGQDLVTTIRLRIAAG